MDRRRLSLLVLAAQGAAFWPVWGWYVRRSLDASDEPWGLLALVTAIGLSLAVPGRAAGRDGSFAAPALITLAYAAAFPWVPPLGHGLLALAAVGATLAVYTGDRPFHPARLLLFALATPLLPTLQFMLGHPLRVVAGETAAVLLRVSGLPVVREGGLLSLGSMTTYVDAPCSGVRMLWAGLYLAGVLSWRLPAGPALACLSLSAGLVVFANALRSAALFYPEAGLLALPDLAHEGIGLAVFGLVAASVAWLARALDRRPCAR